MDTIIQMSAVAGSAANAEPDADKLHARMTREHQNIFARLPATYAASRTQSQQLLQIGGGLSVMEWRTLWDLAEVGPMTIRDLATAQRSDHSMLSRALPAMVRKGYVTMRRGTRDGRQTIVELAEAGRAAYERAAPVMARRRAVVRDYFSDDEMAQFIAYLDRLEEFLRLPVERIAP